MGEAPFSLSQYLLHDMVRTARDFLFYFPSWEKKLWPHLAIGEPLKPLACSDELRIHIHDHSDCEIGENLLPGNIETAGHKGSLVEMRVMIRSCRSTKY